MNSGLCLLLVGSAVWSGKLVELVEQETQTCSGGRVHTDTRVVTDFGEGWRGGEKGVRPTGTHTQHSSVSIDVISMDRGYLYTVI